MCISLYPELDAEALLGKRVTGLGASALLFANNDEVWPEFAGRDLQSLFPGSEFLELAVDGATIPNVEWQLQRVRDVDARIVTLTIGGNDLLEAFATSRTDREMRKNVDSIMSDYEKLVATIRDATPHATLILTTVYDPTDGTGRLPGIDAVLPVAYLHEFNTLVSSIASRTSSSRVADVHSRFLSHGITASPDARWYWPQSIIEPSMRGASEIRRLWLEPFELAPGT